MGTTRQDIERWINQKPEDCTHMIVATDTFDMSDYPVYFPNSRPDHKEKTLLELIGQFSNVNQMSKVMEVYSFTGTHSVESQLAEWRAWHTD